MSIDGNGAVQIHRARTRWMTALIAVVQVVTGLFGGWFAGLAAMLALLCAAPIAGVRPTTGDRVGMAAIALCALVAIAGAVAVRRHRRFWLPLAVGFALGTSIFALFAILLAIPFGASMRDFD